MRDPNEYAPGRYSRASVATDWWDLANRELALALAHDAVSGNAWAEARSRVGPHAAWENVIDSAMALTGLQVEAWP